MVTVIVSIGADAEEPVTSERMRNLRTSLTALNRQILPRDQYRIVLIEQGIRSRLDPSLLRLADEHVLAYNPKPFNRSWGRNLGAVRAAPGVICTFDADIVVPPSFLLRGRLAWQCGARAIRPFNGILYMDRESTLEVHEQADAGESINCESRRYQGGLHRNSKGGCIWTDLRLYLELGGHDERFEGWGNEDNEFWDRLIARTSVVVLDGRLLHLYHERPFEKTPEARGNGRLWRILQNDLLPPPRTRNIGALDRYRHSAVCKSPAAALPSIAEHQDIQWSESRLRDAFVAESEHILQRGPQGDNGLRPLRLRLDALLAARKGDHDTALACATAAVWRDPFSVACLIDLARILIRHGRADEAVAALLRAVVMAPAEAVPYRELGRVFSRVGRMQEAALAYQESLQFDPGDTSTLEELGGVFGALGHLDRALAACDLALKWNGTKCLSSFVRLGRVRLARKEWEAAKEVFEQGVLAAESPGRTAFGLASFAVDDIYQDDRFSFGAPEPIGEVTAFEPFHPALLVGLGEARRQLRTADAAIDAFYQALNLAPKDLEASRHLVLALEAVGRRDEAVGAWISLGQALEARYRFDEAIVAYRQAISYKPDCLRALVQCGRTQAKRGDFSAAIQSFQRVLAIDPEQPSAHTELGRALSAIGQVDAGWHEFAWWCRPARVQSRAFTQPLWDGSPLGGRRLLVWADQELGDTIHWLRYIPVLEQLGARVIVECQARLVPLVRTTKGIEQVIAQRAPLPSFDVHVPLTQLPVISRMCRSAPCRAPYFRADAMLVERWKRRLEAVDGHPGRFTVGLCWAGHPEGINRAFRFAPLTAFGPLADLDTVRFVSLQMGPPAAELLGAPPRLDIAHLQDDACSAADTAALMENLDLIVSVDTMVAHLAGALARPVWLVLPRVADWRWLQNRDDTPLYPTMKLFRQSVSGDWHELITRVRVELEKVFARRQAVSRA
jgi:tetratricopeptide (TPR) repeat protein